MLKDLVFDVGLHDGADTAYYLGRGFRVVAVDANPAMIEKAKKDFPKEVASNRLVLVNAAIADTAGERRFWISDKSEWSSFDECTSKRQGTLAEPVTVRCELFSTILQKYGIPLYLKIDIEGNDAICIRALSEIGPVTCRGKRPIPAALTNFASYAISVNDQVFGMSQSRTHQRLKPCALS
jgi:FkbM family methyltransferase